MSVDNVEVTPEVLLEAENTMSKVKTLLVLRMPFFGVLASKLESVAVPGLGTVATDGDRILYDPEWVTSKTVEFSILVVLHEILHVVFEHLWRRGTRDPKLWNIATDFAINAVVKETVDDGGDKFKFLQEALQEFLGSGLYDAKYMGMGADEIYNTLLADQSQQARNQGGGGQGAGEGDEDSEGSGEGDGDSEGSVEDEQESGGGNGSFLDKFGSPQQKPQESQGTEKSSDSGQTPQEPKNHDHWKNEGLSRTEEIRRRADIQAAASQTHGIGVSQSVRGFFSTFEEPKMNWREYLAAFAEPDEVDYSFDPPDEMYSGCDFILPAERPVIDALKDVYFYVDTSGSISHSLLIEMASEIKGCYEQFGNGSQLYYGCFACTASEPQLLENPEEMDFPISGGTDPACIFKLLSELDLLSQAKAIVILTDGYFDAIPESLAENVPVLWFIVDSGTSSNLQNWDRVFEIE